MKRQIAKFKTQLKKKRYEPEEMPRVIFAHDKKILIHKNVLECDAMELMMGLEEMNKDMFESSKIKIDIESYGDLFVSNVIDAKYFDSREEFDHFYVEDPFIFSHQFEKKSSYFPTISFDDILNLIELTIFIDLEYYKTKNDELEKDIGRKLDKKLVEMTEEELELLEEELFYKLMCKLYGPEPNGESDDVQEEKCYSKKIIFKDFRVLSEHEYKVLATARRGDRYFTFEYITSSPNHDRYFDDSDFNSD
ncbi:unnamed protein product [Brachionus calyciflorus]|uniref:Uncharacterized protein n=1 Tax=Brachionus calyciflorus TaxID=104777 RepID=A0A813NKI5_9BILA|nr:unnamed protein product [Brachionus calyciflorus]